MTRIIDFEKPNDYIDKVDEGIWLFRRKEETVTKMWNTIQSKRKGDISQMLPNELVAPNLYSMIGTDCIIPIKGGVECKSFYYYYNNGMKILIIENLDGTLTCSTGTSKLPAMSLSPFSKELTRMAQPLGHGEIEESNAKFAWFAVIRMVKRKLLIKSMSRYLKILNNDVRKLMYRCRTFSSFFYNNLQDSKYRQQFVAAYPSYGIIFARERFLRQEEGSYLTPEGYIINVNETMRSRNSALIGFQLAQLKVVDAVDRGAPIVDVLADFSSCSKTVVQYIYKRTPHSYATDFESGAAAHLLGQAIKDGLPKEYWPVKRTEWSDFAAIHKFANKGITHIAKKYKIQKLGWNQFTKKLKVPKSLSSILTDVRREAGDNAFNKYDYFQNLCPAFSKSYLKMLNNFDFENIVKFDEYYHANEGVARAQGKHFLSQQNDDDLGAVLFEVPELDIPEETRNNIFKATDVRIKQLTTEKDFELEGSRMKHCVAGYFGNSLNGRSPIFSLTCSKDNSTCELRIKPETQKVKNEEGILVDKITYKAAMGQHRRERNADPHPNHIKAINMVIDYINSEEAFETVNTSVILGAKHDKTVNPDKYKKELREYILDTFVFNKVLAPFFNIQERIDPTKILEAFKNPENRPVLTIVKNIELELNF